MTKVEPGRGSKFWNSRVHCQLQKTFKPVANLGLFEFATVLCVSCIYLGYFRFWVLISLMCACLMQFAFFKYVWVMSLKNTYTLFDDVKFNTRRYFANCAVFLLAPKDYYYPPLFKFSVFWFWFAKYIHRIRSTRKTKTKRKKPSKLYFVTNKKICRVKYFVSLNVKPRKTSEKIKFWIVLFGHFVIPYFLPSSST